LNRPAFAEQSPHVLFLPKMDTISREAGPSSPQKGTSRERHLAMETRRNSQHNNIYDVPEGLLREFVEKVINPNYPGGISPAIKDVILKAVEERKRQETRIATVKEL